MNLHALAGPAIATVNPMITVTIRVSDGTYTTNPDGTQTPNYLPDVDVQAQVQPVTWRDIQMMDGLNLQGVRQKIYLNGQIDGLVRAENKGGDLVIIPAPNRHAGTWLVAQVLEQFPDWVSAAITLQNGA